MNPETFRQSLRDASANVISELYSYADLPRNRASNIIALFNGLFNAAPVTIVFTQILDRLKFLGEKRDNLKAYEIMLQNLMNPFQGLETEHKCLAYFKDSGSYIPPQEIKITVDPRFVTENISPSVIPQEVSYQYIPLREVLKNIFQIPNLLSSTLDFMKELQHETIISNIIQSEYWLSKQASFGDKTVLPILLYNDDFENNNPLGSHKGLGKVGAICVCLPSLPPSVSSKIENIFALSLYKSQDQRFVPLRKFFEKTVEEILFLEKEGIDVKVESGSMKLYFSLAAVIGDNLAINTILGFIKSFASNHPCRFCFISPTTINSVFNESSCMMRTPENYVENLIQNDPSKTGVSGLSVLHDLKNTSVFDVMVVDPMHDIAEGVWEYDLGLILNQLIEKDKFFTCQDLNERLANLTFGKDEERNKPRPITQHQIKQKFIKMSASEAFCLLRNIGVLIGDLIPRSNYFWRLIILLKEIVDIVTAHFVHEHIPEYLRSLIEEYLVLRNDLFPNTMKPKHHLLLHYPRLMTRFGPLWHLATMRCESKLREFKIGSHNSLSRKNLCKSIGIKSQLQVSHRIRTNACFNDILYQRGPHSTEILQNLSNISYFYALLPLKQTDTVCVLKSLLFKNHTIDTNVLVIPESDGYSFFHVNQIFEDCNSTLYIIVKDVSSLTYYDEHHQAYRLHQSYVESHHSWRCFGIKNLKLCFVSRIILNQNGRYYIPKRWI